ncbi:radical SAM protein [Methanobacterium petrolearium]|uniref:radical SAM protein n=1 Tax=Methanobacterium petrolearium TaxID=710190 RepID=UPI001AE724E6|nr:radical SAM protein [Methanobacterium petrolearium]MBP1946778.1 biotin synthase-like enzyme [Methanobacterium petrolearium]BDZ69749.1 radical SAM protein [Methanobacterium petrolearium]
MNLIQKIKNKEILDLLKEANQTTLKEHGNNITLERAIFLSWWCDKGDCSFCYMSSQKPLIRDPKKARRRVESILAEAEMVRRMGWNIEFLSGGYGAFTTSEIKKIAQDIYQITDNSVWLNVGITSELEAYGEEVIGVTGAVEVANPQLHRRICPSKPLEDITGMLTEAGNLGFKKAITIIIGLGETPEDLQYLFQMIEDLEIDRVIFYSLNPHPDTPYAHTPQPASLYYAGTVAATRIQFPKLEIITGTWVDNLANIGPLILAGANGITKFPLFKMFGTRQGRRVEEEVQWAGRKLVGTFTDLDCLEGESPKSGLEPFLKRYISSCLNNKTEYKV